MFQNAFKCDMISTTCSKMLSNATWFRQHVPNLPTYQPTNLPTYQPTNLPTYQPTFIFIFISCACTGGGRFFVGSWPWSLAPPVHAQECCACTRVLCMHKK